MTNSLPKKNWKISTRIKKSKLLLIGLLCLCIFVFGVFMYHNFVTTNNVKAADPPSITAVTGTFEQGESIIVSGNDFGLKETPTPVIFDDVEAGDFDVGWQTTGSLIVATDSRHANSAYAGFNDFKGSGDGSLGQGTHAYFTGPNNVLSEKWFAQYWFKLDEDFDWGQGTYLSGDENLANVKIFRMWNPGSIDENFAMAAHTFADDHVIYTTEYVDNHGGGDWVAQNDPTTWTKGVWHSMQFEFQESALDMNDGVIRVWFDGELVVDDVDIKTREDFTEFKRPFILGFYNSWRDANEDSDSFWIDDAYIDNTWARVEIGNDPIYENSTHREIQVPTTWSSNEIQLTASLGSFDASDNLYLFVIDESGTASDGYQVSGETIQITQAMVGDGPYYLDQAGETYVLTEDITTTGSTFVFAAQNVTLDLNQKTVTFGTVSEQYRYGIVMPPPYPHVNVMWTESDITIWENSNNAIIKNGSVVQGAGDGAKNAAIIAYGGSGRTVQGTEITISGDDTSAMTFNESGIFNISENIINDNTNVISNRHSGRAAIDIISAFDGTIEIHDNIINNCRQWGIRVARRDPDTILGHIYNNEIYADTIVTNGYGVGVHGAMLEVYDNTIQATNGRGIQLDSRSDQAKVYNNNIDITELPMSDEYSRVSSHGIKLEYCTNAEVYNNHVISNGYVPSLETIGNASALNITAGTDSNNWVHDNTFIARHLGGDMFNPNDYSMFATAMEVVLIEEGSNLKVENNTFITNDRFFSSTDWRGSGYPDEQIDASDVSIVGNTWQREETEVPTVKHDIFWYYSSVENLKFSDSLGDNDFRNYGTGWSWEYNQWSEGFTGTINTREPDGEPIPNIEVEVRDSSGSLVNTIVTDINGEIEIILDDFWYSEEGYAGGHVLDARELNPYTFTALFPGDPQTSDSVEITQPDWEVIFSINNEDCSPDWDCTDWSICVDSYQTRQCTDQNSCGTDAGRPDEVQACDSTAPGRIIDLSTIKN